MRAGRPTALVIGLVLLSGTTVAATAEEEPQPATAATALGQLAASMAPGTWAELSTLNMVPTLAADGLGGSILDYAEDGAWDPVSQQFFFIGCDHPVDQNGDLARFVAYSAVTNSWRVLPEPYWFPSEIMHGYDHNAIDAGRGIFYHRQYSQREVYRYDIAAGSWSQLPSVPVGVMGYSACCMGLEYFPEMNGLVLAGSVTTGFPEEAYLYSDTTAQWSRIASGTPMGTYNHFVEYNPVHKEVLYGGGNGSRELYSISETGAVTTHPLAPIPLGILAAIVTVDPVSGDYLVLGKNGEFYSYDVVTETWTSLPGPAPVFSPVRGDIKIWQTLATPVGTHGVVMFVKFYFQDPVPLAWVYLYKHAQGGTSDTIAPTAPTALDANAAGTSQISLQWSPSTDAGGSGLSGYRVERCQGTGCASFAEIATPETNTLVDTGLTPNTSYRYRVRAEDGAGNLGGYSNVAGAATLAPAATSGLVAAYGFSEGTGSTAADASGNSNAGAITGAVWNATGKFGSSLTFQGGSDVVLIQPSTSLNLSTGMTLEAWVYPTSLQAGWRPVVQRAPDAYLLHAGSTQAPLRPVGGGTFNGVLTYITSPAAIPANAWSHIATTWDGTTLREYVNGIQTNSTPRSGVLQTTATGAAAIRIGANTFNERFIGRTDEVRIYNRALSAAEIGGDMSSPVGAAAAVGPPGVPDGISGAPMRVGKVGPSGSSLTVSWDSSTCTGASGYRIVYGGGSQLPTALGGAFAVAGTVCSASSPYSWASPPTTIDPGGLVWWIVTAVDSTGVEGSWGLDGLGSERNGPGPGGSSGSCGTTSKSVSNHCGQ